jgi:ABC-type sugar transport system substrate-binding protein
MKFLVSLPHKDNEFQIQQTEAARVAARLLGVEVEILYAENNPVLQIQQILRTVRADSPPSGLVVEPIATQALETVLRKAAAADIGAAVLNGTVGYVEALRAEFPHVGLFRVASDQVEIGRLQGLQVRALLPSGGTLLYLHGPHASTAAQERFRGLEEVLASGPVMRLIVLDGHWSGESAERAVAHWLRLRSSAATRLDLVAAQDDAMAAGARRALRAAVPCLGLGGVPDVGQRMVNEGALAATVIVPSSTGVAIEHLARWLRRGVVPASIVLPVRSYPAEPDALGRVRRSA